MRKLPDCPRCQEDELWLWRGGDRFEVKCYQCGWASGIMTLATGEELDAVIAKTVNAQEPQKGEVTSHVPPAGSQSPAA